MSDDVKDLQGNVAIGMLIDFQKQGKLSMEKCELFKKKFIRLHDTIVHTFQNHQILYQKAKKSKADLNTEKIKLEQATNKQIQTQEYVEQLNSDLKKAEAECEIFEHKLDVLNFEADDLEHDKISKKLKIQDEEKEARTKIEPEMERYNLEIDHLKDEFNKKKVTIENEQKLYADMNEKINNYQTENEELINEISNLHGELIKIKDEPLRYGKGADILTNAFALLQSDLQGILEDTTKKEKNLSDQTAENEKLASKLSEYENTIDLDLKEIQKNKAHIKKYKLDINKIREENQSLTMEKAKFEAELKNLIKVFRRNNDRINSMKKSIENSKKEYKTEEGLNNKLKTEVRELEMNNYKYKKEEQDLKNETSKMEEEKNEILEGITLLEGKRRIVVDKTDDKNKEKQLIENKIQELEKEILEFQLIESNALKTIKNLSGLRESMARKASSAMSEVRETREELKIKELLILDLRKKQQETETKLNNFKALYEEVKAARNRYVNMIQNSSQCLAELKEKIKILQNELEILKNEKTEKDRTLTEYKHILQLEIHRRDKRHAKLNKLEFTKKQKKEIVDQNINEIEKLNMIIMSLEKEMVNLRRVYEIACESRNSTGVQLIDRNDELCILYEKSNIQESILKNGESEIKRLEDDIKMIKIEISEVARKIEVSRKSIDVVPKLADNVIQLKNELDLEKQKERKLAEELENPENKDRLKELGGEDPDQEALLAKCQVLEERLNSKKENLLEKELILDEITNLSEKLRKQAIDGRQTTLELSEKVNSFQARLKDITRKMMATISELSMFQANVIKLQHERDELESNCDDAKLRVEQNLPPRPETEIEYLKMLRDKKRYEEERSIRTQREELEKNIPPFATKTTAQHRYHSYIPDEIGLPKPYGKLAEFYPNKPGANMRHFKKPKLNDVEI